MPKDLPLWAERNRKIDVLRFTPTAKPPVFSNSLRSIIQYRCRDFSLSPFLSESQKTRPFPPPQPHRGHNRHRYKSAKTTLIPRIPQHNIIYRDCVTGRWGPFPTACFRFAHNLDYVKRLLYKNAKVRPSKDALSGRTAI